MKKKITALILAVMLCFAIAMPAFAAETQYTAGQYVTFSGHTDFGYYYTYTAGNTNYKCFSVVENGQRVYAAVKESLYEYFKVVFDNQDVSFEGSYQQTAGDGSPVIMVIWTVTNEDGKENLTKVADSVAPALYQKGTNPNFRLFYDLYDDGTVSVAEDGSYMTIDNNPLNLKGGSIIFAETGLNDVKRTHKALGLPDWLYEEMMSTRAIDGRQKESFDNVTDSWTYHPDKGLEVLYRSNH